MACLSLHGDRTVYAHPGGGNVNFTPLVRKARIYESEASVNLSKVLFPTYRCPTPKQVELTFGGWALKP